MAAAPSFLEDVRSTNDGFLWMQSNPKQRSEPPLLPHSQNLWRLLHAPVKNQCPHPPAKNNPDAFSTQELIRSKGLLQAIQVSIAEIEQMKDGKADKSLRLAVNRLKKQQTARLNRASVGQQQDELEEQAYSAATLRTIKTLNSIRAIFPLLIRMFHHEQKNNRDLEIIARNKDGEVIGGLFTLEKLADEKRTKKHRHNLGNVVWLLGDYVFDTAKRSQLSMLNESVWRVLECFVTEQQIFSLIELKDVSDSFWETLLPMFIEDQRDRTHVPSPLSLFDSLPPEHKAQVFDTATTCDERYLHVFHHKNEDAQKARVLYQAAVDRLISSLRCILQQRYKGSEVRVYGSCLSNLSLGKSSDVDISLHLPAFAHLKHLFETGQISADFYEKEMKNHVYRTNGILCSKSKRGFRMQECVTRARVPVIKGSYLFAGNPYSPDGSIDFDICFANEIAIVNSALLSEYTFVDERVKCFLLSIKAWARHYQLSSAADSRISSYAWVNLGIFYLQCIGFVPNLQCRELMAQHGFELDPADWFHHVNDFDTGFMPWKQVAAQNVWSPPEELKDIPVTLLMYGFFHFYTRHFPTSLFAVSMKQGSIKLPRAAFDKVTIQNLCIEDPFETHCSHSPHDLGRPAGESGFHAIEEVMCESEAFLRRTLAGEGIDAEGYFWRLCEAAETPTRSLFNSTATISGSVRAVNRMREQGHHLPLTKGNHGSSEGRGNGRDSRASAKPLGRNRCSADQFEEEKKSVSGDRDIVHPGATKAHDEGAMVHPRMSDSTTASAKTEFHERTSRQPRKNCVKAQITPKQKGRDQGRGEGRSNRNRYVHGKGGPRANGKNVSNDHSEKDKSVAKKQEMAGSTRAVESCDKSISSKTPNGQTNRTKNNWHRGGQAGRGGGSSRRKPGKTNSAGSQKKKGAEKEDLPVVKQGARTREPTGVDGQ